MAGPSPTALTPAGPRDLEDAETNAPTSATSKIFNHPLNAWYVAAWEHEVSSRKPLARTVANRPLALWRTRDGRISALADACWHRLAPLSKGKVIGDELQCPYHGLRFNRAGRCTGMPAQNTINPSALVPSFPVVERYRFVWVWLGDPDLADPDLVPDMHQMNSQGWAGDGETIYAHCNYQLMLDNLMDLTHEEFVHSSSIGQDELSNAEFKVTHDETHVVVSRWMRNVDAPPLWKKNLQDRFPGYDGKVDRWQIIQFEAPSTIRIDVGVAKAGTGAPEGDRSQGVTGTVMNTITPETDRTCHYFWSFMRDWCLDSQTLTTFLREGGKGVFGEDEDMLVAQQAAIDANPDYEFYSLNIDAGGMWVRRILDRMLQAEGRPSDARITGEL
ncbi:aromatic ring-hydroxylating dioxygenase subunit alpha [Rhodococcus sp. T2V]|nr:aromatic ring-hydroxylating dioxygenase subunit alpha [Rhodococcus sp. T2V]